MQVCQGVAQNIFGAVNQTFKSLQETIGHITNNKNINSSASESNQKKHNQTQASKITKDLQQVNQKSPINETYKDNLKLQADKPKLDSVSNYRNLQKEELGRATWHLLHTVAASYPKTPSVEQKYNTKALIRYIGKTYPCETCSKDFRRLTRQNPPQLESQKEFKQWMCQIHNQVNQKIGKPTFNCQLVDSRWSQMDCLNDEGIDGCSIRKSP